MTNALKMQRDAIILTLGQDFLNNIYPGGRASVITALERMNESDDHTWSQFCGGGIPNIKVEFAYLAWDGKVQYRLNVLSYKPKVTGAFGDGGMVRRFRNKNIVEMEGPVIKAPHDISFKGCQGIRYTELLF